MRVFAVLCVVAVGCGPRTEAGGTGASAGAGVLPSGTSAPVDVPAAAGSGPVVAAPIDSASPVKKVPPMPEVAVAGPGRLHVKGADYEGVIAEGGDWTPSPRDVADAESALGPALADHELGKHQPARELKREYRGETLKGIRVLTIQLSCKFPGWPADPLPSVKGGGACYGRASYDVAAARVTDVWANGPK